ncbi:GAF and ANTAR domain-containing protein [Promicromonospora sp. NPDC059942]|uniref:GAF and ANTAR domain-containing protein n=1 Tax=Promicromonospora sp. NPDC059942 TaxID=3347009 RepID=UPI00364A1780
MDPPELLSLLARSFADTEADRPLPARLCEACVDAFRADGGALTVLADAEDQVAVSTPGAFEQLEPLEEVLGEGPVHQALAENRLVVMRIGAMVGEYPVFSHLAGLVAAGATLYAVPMQVGSRVVGVLSLYGVLGREHRRAEDLQFAADVVGADLLRNAGLLNWTEKAPFHQATGMVAIQLGIRPEDASALIRAHAFVRSTSLLAVAEEVLQRRGMHFRDE